MLRTWILSDGKAGTEGQAIGLANALGLEYTLFRVKAKWPWKYLPACLWWRPLKHITPNLSEALDTAKPNIIIAGGRITAMPTKYLRDNHGIFTIFILNPYISPKHFDLVICPQHDHLQGDNVIEVRGAIHRLTDSTIDQGRKDFQETFAVLPAPRIAVLVGGNTKHVQFTEGYVQSLVEHIKPLALQTKGSILMTTSRRTPVECVAALKQSLEKSGVPFYLWDGHAKTSAANPYMGILAWADAIVVTGDSASMAAEAAFTGKPVYIYDVPGNPPKFRELHQTLYAEGYAKPLAEALPAAFLKWVPKSLNELSRIAHLVQEKLKKR